MDEKKGFFVALENDYPPFFRGKEIAEYFPWVTWRRLATLCAEGRGPARKKVGKEIIIPRRAMLEWLDSRTVDIPADATGALTNRNPQQKREVADKTKPKKRGRPRKEDEVRFRQGGSL